MMKLILRSDVDHLGRLGDIVNVKPGYGRNYLVPQGLAAPATEGNIKAFELERKKLQAKMDAVKAEAQALADRLAEAPAIVRVRVGEGGKMYGAVTSAMIVDVLAEMGIEVDRKKVVLEDPIRALGEFKLPVKLHPDVDVVIHAAVVRHTWVEGDPIVEEEVVETAAETEEATEEAPEAAETVEEEAAADDAEQADDEIAE